MSDIQTNWSRRNRKYERRFELVKVTPFVKQSTSGIGQTPKSAHQAKRAINIDCISMTRT